MPLAYRFVWDMQRWSRNARRAREKCFPSYRRWVFLRRGDLTRTGRTRYEPSPKKGCYTDRQSPRWKKQRDHTGGPLRGRLAVDYLPAYAPELNPVEYIWGYWKHHELPNFCPHDFSQLSYHARHTLRRMRRRPMLVMAFWKQANLFPL